MVIATNNRVWLGLPGVALFGWCMVFCPQSELLAKAPGHECCHERQEGSTTGVQTCASKVVEPNPVIEFASALPLVIGDAVAPPAPHASVTFSAQAVRSAADVSVGKRVLRL